LGEKGKIANGAVRRGKSHRAEKTKKEREEGNFRLIFKKGGD